MSASRFPKDVALAAHPPSEGWEEAPIYWLPSPPLTPFDQERCELAALLRRRVVVQRRRRSLTWEDVFAALSGLPQADLDLADLKRLARRLGDRGTEPRCVLRTPKLEVFSRCQIVAAVVAAASLTRRPMLALTALSTRYLMEGRAVVVRK